MTKLDRQIRFGGLYTALSLVVLLFAVFAVYHLITGFGLSYFNPSNNIGLENFSKGGSYAKATVTEAYSIRRDTEGEYYICPCPDGRSSFILFVPTKNTDWFNKKITKGKTVKVKGQLELLDESDKSTFLSMAQRIGHGFQAGLLRSCRLNYMRFGDYFNKHIILNSIMSIVTILVILFIIRYTVLGAGGNLRSSARKRGYDYDGIKRDFENTEKFGDLFIGNRYIVRKAPLDVFAADDIKSAYKKTEVSRFSQRLPIKARKHYVVIEPLEGKGWKVNCGSEKKAQAALEALQKFSYITIS